MDGRRKREFAQLRAGGWTVVTCSPFRNRRHVQAALAAATPVSPSRAAASRPAPSQRLFLIDCPACCRVAGPFVLGEAERLAGTHDDLIHRGRLTTEIRPDDESAPTPAGAA